eukprot:6480729-Amphidinium_carterae.1
MSGILGASGVHSSFSQESGRPSSSFQRPAGQGQSKVAKQQRRLRDAVSSVGSVGVLGLKGLRVLGFQGHEIIVLGNRTRKIPIKLQENQFWTNRSGYTFTRGGPGQDLHLHRVGIDIYNRSGYTSTSAGAGHDLHVHEQ